MRKVDSGCEKLINIATYIPAMATTIQVSGKLIDQLKAMKMHEKESYEEIIWDLIEDTKELSDETIKHIKQAEDDVKAGRTYTHEQAKKELGL